MPNVTLQSTVSSIMPTWCPGCGNFGIMGAMRQAFAQMEIPEEELVVFYGVGCSGNMADFNKVYGFHALHGRAIANAIGAKLANHKLKIIVIAGDGDTYGEGLNHLISAARGNHDITVLVHNNQTYSLTTGQSSPTTSKGTATKTTPDGLVEQPINPLSMTLSAGASFVARGYAGNMPQLIGLIKQAMQHEGFSLLDVMQPCPTFNKINTYQWFQERVYDLGDDYQPNDRKIAWEKSQEIEKIPIGIFYQSKEILPYHKYLSQLENSTLLEQRPTKVSIEKTLQEFK
jgi:2-oxoglutarate/2-oxoacid ferredoxin oxidoreductase subunit beta